MTASPGVGVTSSGVSCDGWPSWLCFCVAAFTTSRLVWPGQPTKRLVLLASPQSGDIGSRRPAEGDKLEVPTPRARHNDGKVSPPVRAPLETHLPKRSPSAPPAVEQTADGSRRPHTHEL